MPAIKVKGSAPDFSPMLPASLLLGGGGEVGRLLLLSGISVEGGVSWDVGGGRLVSAAGRLAPNVGGGMGPDLVLGSVVGLVLVKLMPDGSLENPAPVFLKPPARFTPGGSLKLEFSFFGAGFGSLSLFIFFGGSSVL